MRRIAFAMFVAFFIIEIAYNIFLFKDCMDRGRAAYQCNAALKQPVYIGVENIGQGEPQ